jgi:hypothetical protein
MKQTYYEQCGLVLIEDERKSRLYKVENQPEAMTFKLSPLKNFEDAYDSIKVYPQSNLIISSHGVYTLDGTLIISRSGAEIKLYSSGKSWVIVLDYKRDTDTRYCAIWWNGNRKFVVAFGNLLYTDNNYFAFYIKRNHCWTVYTAGGSLVLETDRCEGEGVEICGNFMIVHAVGNHTLYYLRQSFNYAIQSANIFGYQQLVMCSAHDDFAICADLKGVIKSYFHGILTEFENADHIELFDFASVFSLKRGNKFFLYHFDGQPFMPEENLNEVDFIAGNEEQKTLLISKDDNYRQLKFA